MSDYLDQLRREVLDAHAAARTPSRRRRALRGAPRLAAGAAAVAVLLLIVAVVAREPKRDVVAPRVVAELRVGGIPADATLFDGAIWLPDTSAGTIIRVDPAKRHVTARVRVGGQPEFVAGATRGGLWVHAGTTPGDLTRLSRIDPVSVSVAARFTSGPEGPMTVGAGSVWTWVGATDDNEPPAGLYRYSAATGEPLGRIAGTNMDRLAAAGGSVWALEASGTLVRIDAETGRVVRRMAQLAPGVGTAAGAHALAADPRGAWVLSTPQTGAGTLTRVEHDRVTRRLPVPSAALPVLAAARDGLWTATGNDLAARYRAIRIDPRTGRVTATVDLRGHRPVALVVTRNELWAAGGDGTLVAVGRRP